jgi:hypothetical protein
MRALILVLAVVIAGCDLSAAPRNEQKRIYSASPVRDPGGRHQVDASRNRVWFLTKEGVFLYDASRPARVAFDCACLGESRIAACRIWPSGRREKSCSPATSRRCSGASIRRRSR